MNSLLEKLKHIGIYLEQLYSDILREDLGSFLDWFLKILQLHFTKKIVTLNYSRGEVWLVDLGHNIGSELNKSRPCIIVSPTFYNKGDTLVIVPVTSRLINSGPLYVDIDHGGGVLDKKSSVVLAQIRTVSKKRCIKKLGKLDRNYMIKIATYLTKFIEISEKEK